MHQVAIVTNNKQWNANYSDTYMEWKKEISIVWLERKKQLNNIIKKSKICIVFDLNFLATRNEWKYLTYQLSKIQEDIIKSYSNCTYL